jgi:hypothetical protein
VKLFKKPKSKFYWYDFTVRGRRYRGSTQETRSVRALKAASLKLASVMKNTDPFPSKPTALGEFTDRFLAWVDNGRLEEKTKKFYRNGWRLLKATPASNARVDQITGDCAEQLKFPGSAANANCALRTLRRMLHKAEEWKMIGHAPKIKLEKEHGRHLRLDDEAERRLLEGAKACTWRRRTFELFRDIVILMRDTGMRNQRELYRMRIEKSRLGKSGDLCAGQQDSGRTTTCSDEPSRLRAFACTVRHEDGRLGVSVQAFCFGSPVLHRSTVSAGAAASRSSERTGPLLCPP